MSNRVFFAVLAAVGVGCIGLLLVVLMLAIADPERPKTAQFADATAPGVAPAQARWIVAGGGPTPESNEVSIEDDLRLAAEVFGGPGVTLYASGSSSQAVRVQAPELKVDPLVSELGALFSPRSGRSSRYQAARIQADDVASPETVLSAVREASSAGGPPLLVYLAGHGDRGEKANDDAVVMWANRNLTPVDLADAVTGATRQTRFVITTCFSGGFAELVFANADETAGPSSTNVCGLFSSTWDREAGGCDPNPDRGVHDGYGVHFLSALDGEKRDGTRLKTEVLDIDDDGKVSLLDAHTFARLSSKSIDVPTTTSERWLRSVVPEDATGKPMILAHEDAVIGVFGKHLDAPTESSAREKLDAIDAELARLAENETTAARAETEAFWDASAAVLARWPVLDDPWHPLWSQTVNDNRDAIAAFLKQAPEITRLRTAMDAVDQAAGQRAELEVRRAPLHRLLRAFQTKRLASALAETGGPDWDRYRELRACENSAP